MSRSTRPGEVGGLGLRGDQAGYEGGGNERKGPYSSSKDPKVLSGSCEEPAGQQDWSPGRARGVGGEGVWAVCLGGPHGFWQFLRDPHHRMCSY